jgi:hypothetical protein
MYVFVIGAHDALIVYLLITKWSRDYILLYIFIFISFNTIHVNFKLVYDAVHYFSNWKLLSLDYVFFIISECPLYTCTIDLIGWLTARTLVVYPGRTFVTYSCYFGLFQSFLGKHTIFIIQYKHINNMIIFPLMSHETITTWLITTFS